MLPFEVNETFASPLLSHLCGCAVNSSFTVPLRWSYLFGLKGLWKAAILYILGVWLSSTLHIPFDEAKNERIASMFICMLPMTPNSTVYGTVLKRLLSNMNAPLLPKTLKVVTSRSPPCKKFDLRT